METKRAGRNRTLILEPAEVLALKRRLLHIADLKSGEIPVDSIINADTMEAVERLPDGFADLIIIDPPYNLSKTFNGNRFAARSEGEYEEYLSSWFPSVCRKLKKDGSAYVCCDWKCSSSMQRVISKELTVLNRITWQREKGRGSETNWKNSMEDIWFAVRNPKDYRFDVDSVKMKRKVIAPYRKQGQPKDWTETEDGRFRITHPSNFWDDITVPFWSMPENTDHPTQKPEKLFAKLILASSELGDIVFDPFCGSGTSCVVAKKLSRHFCGIEMEEEYCLLSEKRLSLAESDKSIQGYEDGVFWERNSKPVK
ncbi:MAG TPA: site-specific DNA-methyltransferase [Spirochaetaceae bacterium]|nr:site-specific DNA-methyltransferase [Spirochaetaceae bacterium]